MKNDLKRNGSGCLDPTAYQAIMNADAAHTDTGNCLGAQKPDRWTKQIGTNVEKTIQRNDSINYSLLYSLFVTLRIFILKRGS